MNLFTSNDFVIEIGSILDSSLNDLLLKTYSQSKVVIIVDENTHDYCLEYLLTSFDSLNEAEVMLLPVGEENKVMEVCFQVWQALTDYQVGRKDLVINLGGGVVTDMGGFIASIYKRGVDFIHIPTSLLGMVDASIGGKVGIDLGPYKNQLGVFSHPKKIYIDSVFLGTLPEEELLNGFAEMLKHTLINDRIQWDKLKKITTLDQLKDETMILDSVKVKFDIVEKDPLEKNERKKLNFGHTIGHAIEGFFLDTTPIAHGHAVAIGMLAESFISMKQNRLKSYEYYEIELFLTTKFSMIQLDEEAIKEIIQIAKNDKKNESGKIFCALLNEIGECTIDNEIQEKEISDALFYLNKFAISMN
jgi:3-dehydroquinate synthase